jgi:hypothetical protein
MLRIASPCQMRRVRYSFGSKCLIRVVGRAGVAGSIVPVDSGRGRVLLFGTASSEVLVILVGGALESVWVVDGTVVIW